MSFVGNLRDLTDHRLTKLIRCIDGVTTVRFELIFVSTQSIVKVFIVTSTVNVIVDSEVGTFKAYYTNEGVGTLTTFK